MVTQCEKDLLHPKPVHCVDGYMRLRENSDSSKATKLVGSGVWPGTLISCLLAVSVLLL